MSEAELHQIKVRLHQGERQKAARGELRISLPAGLTQNRDGGVTFNPDEEVQERLRLVFAKFRELHSAKAVVRYLRHGKLPVPVLPLRGPAPHDVVWRAATSARGRKPEKPGLCWRLCLWPATSGPITATPRQCADRDGGRCTRGVVDLFEGRAPGLCRLGRVHGEPQKVGEQCRSLRCGTVRCTAQRQCLAARDRQCGRCGRACTYVTLGPDGDYPVYVCVADQLSEGGAKCQEVRALAVDAEVERLLLHALTPDGIALAVAALGELEAEAQGMERQWSLKRERARYDAERARRQFDAVEPENRLVARSLERAWEDACVASSRSNKNTIAGAASRGFRLLTAIGRRYWRSARTCHGFGTPRRQHQRTANKFKAGGQRGHAGSEAPARPRLDQNCLANRFDKRALVPAHRAELRPAC